MRSVTPHVRQCRVVAADKNLLLISGSKVRVLVRPPIKSIAYDKMLAFQWAGKAYLATFLATFCKVRGIRHLGVARAFASRYPLAARIVSQLGEKFFKAVVHVTLGTSLATSGPLAQYSALATDNRLVGSSSPPSPTTHSRSNGDFPVQCE